MMIKKKPVLFILTVCIILLGSGLTSLHGEVKIKVDDTTRIGIDALFRTYMLNDQRIQWSGLETTFGAESVLTADIHKKFKWGNLKVYTQLFINQAFSKNILADDSRQKYLQNFEVDTLELKQLYIQVRKGNFTFGLGKHHSKFGRDYTYGFNNGFFDYPFIRNEAIRNFETGLFIGYTGGLLTLDLAVVNGSEDMDTNSSKAGIARIGLQGANWSIGVSAKAQDGIGSEWQKQYNNHAGFDLMFQIGALRISSEFIYDEYGFHREFSIDDVFWGRSYYYRDIFYKHKTPIKGYGGYVDVQYEGRGFLLELNYGQYQPEEIGHPYHDESIQRIMAKIRVRIGANFHIFGIGLMENEREKEPLFDGASDYGVLIGFQYRL
jgi:hypothetical protein